MFNQTYINNFSENKYLEYLRNPKKLEFLKRKYLLQYIDNSSSIERLKSIDKRRFEIKKQGINDSEELRNLSKEYNFIRDNNCSDAEKLAFKESLDHYILKRILEDKSFIETKEFENYWNYIKNLTIERKFTANNKDFYLELNTNVVFRNPNIRKMIFSKFLSNNAITSNENLISTNNKIISRIVTRLKKREIVSQNELDFIGDYIYTSRDFSNDIAETFVEYMFNEIENNSTIKPSVPIMGAITSYFTQCYTKDDRVKNSRTFISDFDRWTKPNTAHSSGFGKYCVFQKDVILKTSLISKNSLKKSRTFKENDLYFLMMVSFHELTHEYQKNKAKDKVCTSSGLSNIIKNVLQDNLSRKGKNGKVTDEYKINHDSVEYEIEADEESWRQCKRFIAVHCRQYAYKHGKKSSMELELMCKKNADEVNARRIFSLKQNKDGNLEPYATYDVRNTIEIVKQNPNILKQYPMLKKFFNESGYLKIEAIFTNITDLDGFGLEPNNSGLEFATYMINNESNSILKEIASGKLKESQIDTLMLNVYNVIHQNVLKIRSFEKINLNNFDETVHRYDLKKHYNSIFNHYFIECAKQIYYALQFMYHIRKNYPNINSKKYFEYFNKYYIGYFGELFKKIKGIEKKKLIAICEKYDASNTPELIELSSYIKAQLSIKQNNNQDDKEPQGRKPR